MSHRLDADRIKDLMVERLVNRVKNDSAGRLIIKEHNFSDDEIRYIAVLSFLVYQEVEREEAEALREAEKEIQEDFDIHTKINKHLGLT